MNINHVLERSGITAMQILISSVIEVYNWDMPLLNSNISEKVEIFNSIIFNILSNVKPREAVACYGRDPPYFKESIKRKYLF